MKRFLSILLVMLMLFSTTVVFAEAERPARIVLQSTSKVSTADATVLSDTPIQQPPTWGPLSALFDGVGMIGDQTNSTTIGNVGFNKRLATLNKTGGLDLAISFDSDKTFREIRWTEVRKVVGEVEINLYNNNVKLNSEPITHTFTDSSTATHSYLRKIDLGQNFTVDKIEINIKTHLNTNIIQIMEMEFWNIVSAPSITDNAGKVIPALTSGFELTKAFDGKFANPAAQEERFVAAIYDDAGAAKYQVPITIAVDLGATQTFNYAQINEFRCAIGEIEVHISNDGKSFEKIATMPKFAYDGIAEREYIHSVGFDSVSARYVNFVIKELAPFAELNDTRKAMTISEIALYNYPTISEEAVVYPVQILGKDITADTKAYNHANTHVTLNNSSEVAKTYVLYGASYNDGVLNKVSYSTFEVAPGKQKTVNISNFATNNADKLGVFVWDANLVPIIEAVEIEKQ